MESITVLVEDSGIEVFVFEVCSASPPFPMNATPTGGTYTATDCPTCIQNDTFVIAEMAALGLAIVEVSYDVASSGGCEGSNTFTIAIENPGIGVRSR